MTPQQMNIKTWVLSEKKSAVLLYKSNGECEDIGALYCHHCPFKNNLCSSPGKIPKLDHPRWRRPPDFWPPP